jgi:TonB-linked SusC/RagA family outer membrane protein
MNKNQTKNWRAFKRIFLTTTLILYSVLTYAQSKYTINGSVTDANTGEPLPGVVINIENTIYGAQTDLSGKFSINATLNKASYSINYSYLSYKSKSVKFNAGDLSSITLSTSLNPDLIGLDEVVITGNSAGTTRKQLGSYVSTIKAEDLNKGAATNALAALQGKTAGAQISQNSGDPAGGMSVRLRGISSISSSSDPLYIVDGVIVNNSTVRVTNTQGGYDGSNFVGTIGQNRLVDINPADIERIEVLNGAAASAIYGSRANAGVVQIFTKRGRTGVPVVNFSTSFTTSELRKKVDVNSSPTKFGGSVDTQTQDILTPTLTNTTAVTRYDYQDYIFRTATGTDNNLSVSGGNDDTKYYASLSYFNNQGIVKNTDFERVSLRVNLDQKVNKWASFTAGLNYIYSGADEKPDGNSFFSPLNSINILGNFHNIQTRDANGNIKAVGERGRVNPVSIIEDIKQKQLSSRILANTSLKLYPTKNLILDFTIGLDNSVQNGSTYIPPFAYNVSTGFFGGGPSLSSTLNGYSSAATNYALLLNNEANATYNAKLTKDIESVSQIGYSMQFENGKYSLLQGRGLSPLTETVNAASTILPSADIRSKYIVSGAYFQQNFKFKDQFFVTGAVRMDGSTVFGKDQRNQIYLKGSGSYVLSSTDYWENLGVSSFWDLLKLRVAYGESGNLTGINPYDRFNQYSPQAYLGNTYLTSSTRLANSNIKPEKQKELEFGTDMSFFKGRTTLGFNYYVKKVQDLLINRETAPTTGFSTILDNFGSLENKGFEIILGVTPIQNTDFSWNLTAIFNKNKNKAVDIGQALTLFSTNGGAPVAILQGQPIGVFYGTFYARDNAGNIIKNAAGIPQIERGVQNSPSTYTVQRDANGQPLSTGTPLRRVIGDPNPDYTGSLVNELKYKNFGFRFQFDAVQGNEVFNADFRTRQGVGNGKLAEQEQQGQLPRGYISGIYPIEEFRIDDGSFVKLREISLSYRLSKLKTFKDLTLSLTGRNIFSIDNYKGYDPEVNAGGQSTILRGIDFGAIPIPRTISFGLSTKF